ncbi:hypothetical protein B0J14DRAFT_468567 [Halenospora varia]|nr:hypothetical protein B0J14DRAFT_468567 [Halenospora varia]
MRWTSRSTQAWKRTSLIGIILILTYYYLTRNPTETPVDLPVPAHPRPPVSSSNSCHDFPSSAKIVVAIKTGASEAASKLPAQMKTTLRCASHVVFFSDLEQDIGEYHLHDALSTVSHSVMDNNLDFKFYQEQLKLWKSGKGISSLKGMKSPEAPDKLAAWTLDKYKFIHSLEKTWELKPDMDWYLLFDADTYVIWSNLLTWLETMDPNKKSYFGSEVSIDGTRFAHGGSGIIMSRAAVYEVVVEHNGTAAKWDPLTHEKCCGDLVLGEALKEYGTELQDVWPSMSGETPATMPLGPGTPQYLCSPALTFHHLSPKEMQDLVKYEEKRPKSLGPLTHMELFKNLTVNSLSPRRKNWDNLASDPGEFGKTGGVEREATTVEECAKFCTADKDCFQYTHHDRTCYIGMSIRLGYEKKADEGGVYQSGWNLERLERWIGKQTSCDHVTFPAQGA